MKMEAYTCAPQKFINITHKEQDESWENEKYNLFCEANAIRHMRYHYRRNQKDGRQFFVASTLELTDSEVEDVVGNYKKNL